VLDGHDELGKKLGVRDDAPVLFINDEADHPGQGVHSPGKAFRIAQFLRQVQHLFLRLRVDPRAIVERHGNGSAGDIQPIGDFLNRSHSFLHRIGSGHTGAQRRTGACVERRRRAVFRCPQSYSFTFSGIKQPDLQTCETASCHPAASLPFAPFHVGGEKGAFPLSNKRSGSYKPR
jgi:hypothetical protein